MTTVSVVIPWKGGCEHRSRALGWVMDRWGEIFPGFELVAGGCDGEWSKGAAVADALSCARGDVVVIADADVFPVDASQVVAAIASLDESRWAVPHLGVWRWTEAATARILEGLAPDLGDVEEPPYRGWLGGGITILSRAQYDEVPIDPRFRGWGQEDEAWALALRCLAGRPWHGRSDLWHLYHPPQARCSRGVGSERSLELLERYVTVSNSPDGMRDLLSEVA